jgi:hypothetical protein
MIPLTKTEYCNALECPKILWLDRHRNTDLFREAVLAYIDEKIKNEAVLEKGRKTGELARGYFGKYDLVPYDANKPTMLAETQRLVDARAPVICEASFSYDNCFCSVDILRCNNEEFEIVEIKSSTGPKPYYFDDMAFQYYVLSSCGYNIKKISLMHINNQYIRNGDINIQKLFTVVDCTEEVKGKQQEVAANIKRIRETAEAETEPDAPIGEHCDKPWLCHYKKYCFRHITQETNPSIGRQPPKITIDKPAIRAFLDTLSYPLYYLDFETMQEIVPPFDNTRPYQQIPFQYSLHIQKEKGGETEHREFLAEAGADPRRALAERLCEDIPKDVCVLAFVMSFEKMRIKELAGDFPDLAPHLMAIHGNIKDLYAPFKKGAWYSEAQEGSASIKYVLPAMFPDDPELNYNNLDLIHNGTDAMTAYADLPNRTPEEQERTRAALLAYCRLDTWSMVKIVQKLQEIVNE